MNQIPNIEEWEKEFAKLIPETVDILHEIKSDRIFCSREAVVRFIHHQLQKAREGERKIIKLRIDYDRRKGIPAEETVNDIYDSIELKDHSELDKDSGNVSQSNLYGHSTTLDQDKVCKVCHGHGNNGADDALCLNCGGTGKEEDAVPKYTVEDFCIEFKTEVNSNPEMLSALRQLTK
jgi:hypothetical protein